MWTMLSISHNSLWILNSQHNSATTVVHWTHNVLSVYEYWTEKSTNAEHTRQFSVWSLEASHHRDESWLYNSLLYEYTVQQCMDIEHIWILNPPHDDDNGYDDEDDDSDYIADDDDGDEWWNV